MYLTHINFGKVLSHDHNNWVQRKKYESLLKEGKV